MDIKSLRQLVAERDSFSVLETVDVHTGVRSNLKEFDYVIEAPNWTRDGKYLMYNSRGRIYTYALSTGDIKQLETGFAVDCNNDHVLSPDNTQIAVSHFTNEDATSRIYILPFDGGHPALVTEQGPSYLHGWSPDGRTLAYCAERGGQYDIYTISVDGGPETRWLLSVAIGGCAPAGGTGVQYFVGDFDGKQFTPDAPAGPVERALWADWGRDNGLPVATGPA
jgi:dipeptidyl aminopeptidase/acylaminoacyl peptidase